MRLYEVGTAAGTGINWDPNVTYSELPDGAYIGQKLQSYDEMWRVCKARVAITGTGGEGKLTRCVPVSSGAGRTSQNFLSTQVADAPAHSREIEVTSDMPPGQFKNGWLFHRDMAYRIENNRARVIFLRSGLSAPIASAHTVRAFANPYISTEIGSNTSAKVAGAITVDIPSGHYYLAKIRGAASLYVFAVGATGEGPLRAHLNGDATPNGDTEIIGVPLNADGAVSEGSSFVLLNIA